MDDPMRISPRFFATDWLALDADVTKDWVRAVEIFEDRIESGRPRPSRKPRGVPSRP